MPFGWPSDMTLLNVATAAGAPFRLPAGNPGNKSVRTPSLAKRRAQQTTNIRTRPSLRPPSRGATGSVGRWGAHGRRSVLYVRVLTCVYIMKP